MHTTVQNLINIQNEIKSNIKELNKNNYEPKIIAVSKTFKMNHIHPLIEYGHLHYGENKVQEAIEKWSEIKLKKKDLNLHFLGKLQTNKVKYVVKIFDYIHSVDNLKLARKIKSEQEKYNKNIKIFIQINLADEKQKSGISKKDLKVFYNDCLSLNLNVIGLMCLPPENLNPLKFFEELYNLNKELNLNEISMGMSADYIDALKFNSTFFRIGSKIFGERI
tara:strand:- start:993 stop:1655 length:663 start_codon:yes stop_codon:yes gene_type:complete